MILKRTKRKYLLILLIIIAFVAHIGRVKRDPWETIQEDAPLCGAGKMAVSKSRVCYPPFFVPATEWTERGWDTGNQIINQISIVEGIDKHLDKIGFIKQQEAIQGWVNNIQQRMAPYRFFIVSVDPVIVVMTSYDYGTVENKSNVELASKLTEQHLGYSPYLVNGYHYGSSVPKMSNYKWFSPKYTKNIQEVIKDGQTFTIQTKTGTLIFGDAEKNGWYLITRR